VRLQTLIFKRTKTSQRLTLRVSQGNQVGMSRLHAAVARVTVREHLDKRFACSTLLAEPGSEVSSTVRRTMLNYDI
jgi:hypothetical protein